MFRVFEVHSAFYSAERSGGFAICEYMFRYCTPSCYQYQIVSQFVWFYKVLFIIDSATKYVRYFSKDEM